MTKRLALALAGLSLGACFPSAQADERTVTVRIEHSRFLPSDFTFEAGQTVEFVIVNEDPIAHEFLIGDEASQLRHENGTEEEHGAVPGEISIPAGATRTTTYTFDHPTRALLVGCHLPGHYDYGMRGTITVTP